MTADEITRLRNLVGEKIPDNGTDADTIFSDEEIEELAAQTTDLNGAAREGWRVKAARYADMVDISEAGESAKLSDLHKNALKMVEFFTQEQSNPAGGSTRLHRLSR